MLREGAIIRVQRTPIGHVSQGAGEAICDAYLTLGGLGEKAKHGLVI
jgi:hypothetical protein